MELTTKIKQDLLDEKIVSADLRISVLQSKIDSGEENKEGLPSYAYMLSQETLKKNALITLKENL
jgi:hypothetical protein